MKLARNHMIVSILALVILSFSFFVGSMLKDAGYWAITSDYNQNSCKIVRSVPGPEDMAYDDDSGLLFLAAATFRPPLLGPLASNQGLSAGIYLWDTTQSDKPVLIPTDVTLYQPHGIDLSRERSEGIKVAVVDHSPSGDRIHLLQFDRKTRTLTLLKSIDDPLMYNVNDVLYLGDNDIYMTHDHGSQSHWGKLWENYSRLGQGFVSHYDGSNHVMVAEGLDFANGIGIGPQETGDKQPLMIYVASMLAQEVVVFKRQNDSPQLEVWKRLGLPASPDNLDVDANGTLWIGAHLNLFDLKNHSLDPDGMASPGLIVKIENPEDSRAKSEVVFASKGGFIGATSVGVYRQKSLYIGSIYQAKLLKCELE